MIQLADSAPAIPARPVPSPTTRLRQVRSLGQFLPDLGVQIAPAGDGRVAVTLPAEVAELFLEDLEQRAQEWAQAMRKARVQEAEHTAHLEMEARARTGAIAREEDSWLLAYDEARRQGKGHWAAIHQVAGYDPTMPRRLQFPESLGPHMVRDGITRAMARRRSAQRAHRRQEMVALLERGLTIQAIADQVGLSYHAVRWNLKQGGVRARDRRRTAWGVLAEERAKHTQGERETGDQEGMPERD